MCVCVCQRVCNYIILFLEMLVPNITTELYFLTQLLTLHSNKTSGRYVCMCCFNVLYFAVTFHSIEEQSVF